MRTNIIRIEHPSDGLGLWRSSYDEKQYNTIEDHSCYPEISKRHRDQTRFPAFCFDKELQDQISWEAVQEYNFAFKDLAQLETALTREELKECIEALGFHVLMLDVTDYYESPYQIVFKKESIVNKKDISSMFL